MYIGNVKYKTAIIILFITPLIYLPFTLDYFYFPKIMFIYIICSLIAISLFLKRKELSLKLDLNDKFLFVYLTLVTMSTFFSINYFNSIWGKYDREEGIFAIIAYLFLFFISKRFYKFKGKDIDYILLSANLVALYGIMQFLGFDPIPRDPIRIVWQGRAFSTMGNPNFLGSYLTLLLPISVFTYITSKRFIYLLSSGIIYLCLLATMTRGSWLGAFTGILFLIIYIFKQKINKKYILYIAAVFALITLVMNIYTDGYILGRFLTIGRDFKFLVIKTSDYERAGASRIFIWKRVLILIGKRPIFGYGLETLGIIFTKSFSQDMITYFGRTYIFDKAHNEYLHIAVSSGIPSLIVYILLVADVVIKGFKKLKDNILILPFLASIIGYLVQAFFNISVVSVAYVYWIFLGILYNMASSEENVGLDYFNKD